MSLPEIGAEAQVSRSGDVWKTVALVAAAVMLVLALPVAALLVNFNRPHRSRQPARVTAHDSQPATNTATAAFGPVIERVLIGEGDANQRFIDLDTGKQFAAAEFFGPKAEPSPEETQKWWKQNGIDAMGDVSSASRGLVGFEMVAATVAEAEWTGAAPQRLKYWLTDTRPGTPSAMSAEGKLPVTYVFQTREGGRGLLQITGFTDNPSSVKIRYKLVGAKELLLTE